MIEQYSQYIKYGEKEKEQTTKIPTREIGT